MSVAVAAAVEVHESSSEVALGELVDIPWVGKLNENKRVKRKVMEEIKDLAC